MKQKKNKSAARPKKAAAPDQPLSFAAIATKRFTEETRQMLGQHQRNKHGIRRGK